MSNPPPPAKPASDRRLWEFRWVRDLAVLVAIALFVLLAYKIRAILLPVLIGLALAYVINPVVRGAERRWRWPRWLTTGLIQGAILGFFGGLLIYVLPRLLTEVQTLLRRLPAYLESFAAQFNLSLRDIQEQLREIVASVMHGSPAATQPATQAGTDVATTQAVDAVATTAPTIPPGALTQVDLQTVGTIVAKILNLGVQVILTGISLGAYLILAAVITILCMFFFSWRLDGISEWFRSFIPTNHKSKTLHILGRMDVAVSAFVRGRIMQGTILAIVLSIGWSIAGVPYALLLALVCGILNLVPYASIIGLPTAVLLTWVDQLTTGGQLTVWGIVIYPSLAYLVAQQFDNWIVEPLVQGQATGLDPLAILLSVLIGSALAGLFGMLLAVPFAACVKILSEEVLVPKFRAFLGSRAESSSPADLGENSPKSHPPIPQETAPEKA